MQTDDSETHFFNQDLFESEYFLRTAAETYGGSLASISSNFFIWSGELDMRVNLAEATKNC